MPIRIFVLALVATAAGTVMPYLALPAWSSRAHFLVALEVAKDFGAALLAALAFAAVQSLLGRQRRLSAPLGLVIAASVSVALPGASGLVARLLGGAVLVTGMTFPRLAARVPAAAVAILALSALGSAFVFAPAVRPDLILVTIDALRADRVVAPEFAPLTPRIRGLAASGLLFRRAWSTAPWTIPGMSSIFTGVSPSSHGAQFCLAPEEAARLSLSWISTGRSGFPNPLFSKMSPEVETLPMALSRAGYVSAGLSSWFAVARETGFARGFDRFHLGSSEDDSIVVHQAREWLQSERKRSVRPAFLFVHLFTPHQPYTPPGGEAAFDTFVESWDGIPLAQRVMRHREPLPPDAQDRIRRAYDGEVRYADRSFGEILDAIGEPARGSETLVALTSDHGDFLGEKALLDHGHFLYDEATRVPLVVRFPASWNVPPGVRDDAVSNHDLYATFLAAAGVAPRHALTARDLSERHETSPHPDRLVRIENEMSVAMTSLFGDRFAHRFEAVTDGRWKLVLTDGRPEELYDLDSDPAENRNLAAAEPGRVAALARQLEASRRRDIRFRPAGLPAFDADQIRKLRSLGYLR